MCLYAIGKEFQKVIKPGVIDEAVYMVVDKTDLIIQVDCKKFAREFGVLLVNIDTWYRYM